MAMPGKGCFVAWYDLQPGRDADHDHWHTHEHMIERVAIPGFLRGFRYHSLTGGQRLCVMYQTETLATLTSDAYLERLNNPTPWTSRIVPLFAGMNRTLCSVEATYGHGIGGMLLTIQLSAQAGSEDRLRGWLVETALPDLAARAGLCGAHLLIGDRASSETGSQEKMLRGTPDVIADWVVLVEGYDRGTVEQAQAELYGGQGLVAHGAASEMTVVLYSLDFTLGKDEARRLWQMPAN